MNKNDLRYVKTEKNLYETYMRLLKNSKRRISLVMLCDEAMINKSTFYQHYDTLDHLHSEICKKTVSKIISQIPGIEDVFTHTSQVVVNAINIFSENSEDLRLLFSNNHKQLSICIEEEFLKFAAQSNLSEEKEMRVRFAVAGVSRILSYQHDERAIQYIVEFVDKVFNA